MKGRLAIVIGVNSYAGGIPPLACAASDARAVAAALGAHGFSAVDGSLIALDDTRATYQAVHEALTVTLPARRDLDQAIVYFAGHGQAVPDEQRALRGYLLPADAALGRVNYLDMDEIREVFAKLTCRHLLVVLDCCAAGAFARALYRDVGFDRAPMFRARFDSLNRRRSYQLIASAAHDQQALDTFDTKLAQDRLGNASPFAAALLDILTRKVTIEIDRCGVLDATGVFQHVRTAVNGRFPDQLPNLWPLDWHDDGEFLFLFGSPQFLALAPAARKDSPYPGAAPITDPSLCVGRTAEIEQVGQLLRDHGIVLVSGPSGVGITSVINAVAANVLAATGVVPLVVDGLHTLSAAARAERRQTVVGRAVGVVAVIAARDDLVSEWAEAVPPVARFQLPRMDRAAMRGAIEVPAALRYLAFTPAFGPSNRHLVDTLLDNVANEPGGLALLAIALAELFGAYVASGRDDRTIAWSEYTSIATIAARRAEALYQFMDVEPGEREARQASVRDLVLRLTESSDGALKLRLLPRGRLQFADPVETTRTAEVLDAMIVKRIVVSERGQVGLALEAILAAWPRIAAWHAERPTEALQRLDLAALDWAPHPGWKHLLWADERLASLGPLVATDAKVSTRDLLARVAPSTFTKVERDFVVASDQRRRFKTAVVWIVTVAIVVTLGAAALYSMVQRSAAEAARLVAEDREREASRLLALSYVEEARHLLVDEGRPLAALPYLAAARDRDLVTPAMGTMFGLAAAALPDTPPPITETDHPIAMWLDDDRVLLGSTRGVQAYSRKTAKSVEPRIAPGRGIEKLAVSRAGDLVLSGGGGELSVWDATGHARGTPIPIAGELREVGFSADGSRIWAVAAKLTVWRTTDHAPIGSLAYHGSNVQLDEAAETALVGDNPAEVRNVASGARVGRPITSGFHQTVALFPDGRSLATALDNTAEVWDVATGTRRGPPRGPPPEESSDRIVEISTDAAGSRLVTTNEASHAAQVWSARGARVTELFGSEVVQAELDRRGELVLASEQTGYQIWSASTGGALSPVLEQAFSNGCAYELSPNASALAVANQSGQVQLWELGRILPRRASINTGSTADAKDGNMVAGSTPDSEDGNVVAGSTPDSEDGNVVAVCPTPMALATETGAHAYAAWDGELHAASSFAAVGRLAACDGAGRLLTVGYDRAESWDLVHHTHVMLDHSAALGEAAFAADGQRVYAAQGRTLSAWNAQTGARVAAFKSPEIIARSDLAVRPDGPLVVWSNDDRDHLRVFSTTGAALPALGLALAPAAASEADRRVARFSRGGAVLVLTSSKPDSARVYSTQTGAILGTIAQLAESLNDAVPSSDGSLVALVFANRVQIWDVATARPIAPAFPHERELRGVEFGAGDTTLVTWDSGGRLFLWPLPRDRGDAASWGATAARSPYALVNGSLQRR